VITETDDFFCHQTIEPHAHVSQNERSWGDRTYITITDPARFAIDVGMSMYPNSDAMEAYAIASVPGRQWSFRASRDLSQGRYPLWAGPSSMEIVAPMKHWKMRAEPNESGISYDLEFLARGGPYMIRQPEVRKDGRLIHSDVYVFQPGKINGTLTLDDQTFELDGVGAHRDRTWGLRAAGEGVLPHGVLAWVAGDFEDYSFVIHIRDRGDGVPQVRDGAIFYDNGDISPLVDFHHDLEFDYESRQFQKGSLQVTDIEGKKYDIDIEPKFAMYLSGAGYVTEPSRRRGRQGNSFWQERWDLTNPEQVAKVEGLNDNVSVIRCNGEEGTGVIETSLGIHHRYQVAPANVV
jgi:hypothetical protein